MRWPVPVAVVILSACASAHEHGAAERPQSSSSEPALTSCDLAAGSNGGGDSGCRASCGDGVVSAGETCDPESSTPCQSADNCKSVGCMRAQFSGDPSACTSTCIRSETKALINNDGCCPVGATRNKDNDCPCRAGKDCAIGTHCEQGSCLPD